MSLVWPVNALFATDNDSGGCPSCPKKTACLQTQSGRAESGTGGALELHYCDVSRGCSVVSFIGCNKSLTVVILEIVGGCVGQ